MNNDRVAYLDVTFEMLAARIPLPKGSEIVRELPSTIGGCVRFVVRSPEFRTVEPACEMPRAKLAGKKTEDGTVVTCWYDI